MVVQNHHSSFSLKGNVQMISPCYDETREISLLNNGHGNPKKRGREVGVCGSNLISMQSQPSVPRKMIRLDQLQIHQPTLVSTGLQLAFGGENISQNVKQINPIISSPTFLCEEFAASINQYKKEIDLLLHIQEEQLRLVLSERQDTQYKQLLLAVEKSASRILNKKQNELNRTVLQTAQLQNQLAQLQIESIALRTKAMADQATANSLHSQLQQLVSTINSTREKHGESFIEDAGSTYVDPNRSSPDAKWVCRVCLNRTVSIMMLPCQHLCLCEDCHGVSVVKVCPICNCVGNGSIRVLLS